MTFGEVIPAIKAGKRAFRTGWNGKDMWIAYSPGSVIEKPEQFWSPANQNYLRRLQSRSVTQPVGVRVLPCITMKTASGEILMGWLASQTDMLAEDWMVVE